MPMLNTNKLKGRGSKGSWQIGVPTRVRQNGNKEFQCPACEEEGHDLGGEHLVILGNGTNYGCVKYPKNSAGYLKHRDRIWQLVGIKTKEGRPVVFCEPRKVYKEGTLICKHQANLDQERVETLKLRQEYNKRMLEKENKLISVATQYIESLDKVVQNGTFGTPFLVSHQSPSPYNNNTSTEYEHKTIPPHAPATTEKSSQTSQSLIPGGRWIPGCCENTESYVHPKYGWQLTRPVCR